MSMLGRGVALIGGNIPELEVTLYLPIDFWNFFLRPRGPHISGVFTEKFVKSQKFRESASQSHRSN
jgi:hypothetical protein